MFSINYIGLRKRSSQVRGRGHVIGADCNPLIMNLQGKLGIFQLDFDVTLKKSKNLGYLHCEEPLHLIKSAKNYFFKACVFVLFFKNAHY